ncbi:MAG: ribosome maturation factor RimM [Alphaproteobacteria bacterium]|nr:ribosome maturation factor RimM [Alphaproteobacteria bacterium]
MICLGEIVAPHGIKGWVKIKTHTESPDGIVAYGPLVNDQGVVVKIDIKQIKSWNSILVSVPGCTTRTQSEALVKTKLFVNKDQLPQLEDDPSGGGEYYYDDLVGMSVLDLAGNLVGTIASVHNYGAGDFLEIKAAEESKFFTLSFQKDSVLDVDRVQRTIKIDESFLLS